MTPEIMMSLHIHCPQITSLELYTLYATEEAIISAMLATYGGKLQNLVLTNIKGEEWSTGLLNKVSDLFPKLQRFGMYYTSSAAVDVLIELFLAGKFKHVRTILWRNPQGRVITDHLKSAGYHPLPQVELRWR